MLEDLSFLPKWAYKNNLPITFQKLKLSCCGNAELFLVKVIALVIFQTSRYHPASFHAVFGPFVRFVKKIVEALEDLKKRQNKTFICKGIEATGHPVLLYLSWQDHFWFTVYKNGSFFLVKRSRKVCLLSPSTLRHSCTIGLFLLQRQFPCSLPSPRRKKSNQLHLAQKWQRDKRSRVHSFSSTLHITLIWHVFCSSPNRWLCRVWNKAPRSAQ